MKRCQLEIEIDRLKRENAAIGKLRLEREEVSVFVNMYFIALLIIINH